MYIKIYASVLVILLLLFGEASFAKNTLIYVGQDQPKFTITLDSNRTTGYAWVLKKYDDSLLSLISHQYIPPSSTKIGAPGYEEWIFQARPSFFQGSKTAIVSLDYARPWEHKSVKTIVYKIVSRKKSHVR